MRCRYSSVVIVIGIVPRVWLLIPLVWGSTMNIGTNLCFHADAPHLSESAAFMYLRIRPTLFIDSTPRSVYAFNCYLCSHCEIWIQNPYKQKVRSDRRIMVIHCPMDNLTRVLSSSPTPIVWQELGFQYARTVSFRAKLFFKGYFSA